MHSPYANAPLSRFALLSVLVVLCSPTLQAQSSASPIRRALYVALGGDPTVETRYEGTPIAVSAGIEQSRDGSRWAFRLGADYRRQVTSAFGTRRLEDFGLSLSTRYGRASGIVRPYLLGGVGVANLRTRVRGATYYLDPQGLLFPPYSYDHSRWNGSFTTGLGTDLTLGRLRLFTEARLDMYPARFSNEPKPRRMETTKALYFGIKF